MKCLLVLVIIATSVTSRHVHKPGHQARRIVSDTDSLLETRPKSNTSMLQIHSSNVITPMEADGTAPLQQISDHSKLQEVTTRSAHGNGLNPELDLEARHKTCTRGKRRNCYIVRLSCVCYYTRYQGPENYCCNAYDCNKLYPGKNKIKDLCKI